MLHFCNNSVGTDGHTNNAFWRAKIEPDSEKSRGFSEKCGATGKPLDRLRFRGGYALAAHHRDPRTSFAVGNGLTIDGESDLHRRMFLKLRRGRFRSVDPAP